MFKRLIKPSIMVLLAVIITLGNLSGFAVTTSDTYGSLLQELKLIQGDNGDLMESKNISREEMITILSRLYPAEFAAFVPPAKPTFTDVKTTDWSYKYVEFAYKKNITKGKSATVFGKTDLVNYNQVSLFLIRALGYDVSAIPYITAAEVIKQNYDLGLTVPTGNTTSLKRSAVFELLVKALTLEKVDGTYGISMIAQTTSAIDTFLSRAFEVIERPVAVKDITGYYKLYYADGSNYIGEILGTNPHGDGIMMYSGGDVFLGTFKNGLYHGYGIYVWADQTYYEGDFVDGFFEGYGTMGVEDGSWQYGSWKLDEFVSKEDGVTSEEILNGTVTVNEDYSISLVDEAGEPMAGIALSIVDETSGITYSLITDSNGAVNVPKKAPVSILSMQLSGTSAYRFVSTNDRYMATVSATYVGGGTYMIKK